MKYRGWIPNASGYLSFANIRGQQINGRFESVPKIEGTFETGCRVFAVRQLADRPLNNIRSRLERTDTTTSFHARIAFQNVCAANSEPFLSMPSPADAIEGVIVGYPTVFSIDAKPLIESNDISAGVFGAFAGWAVKFRLARNGQIDLDWGNVDIDDFLAIVNIPPERAQESVDRLTQESFNFIKDLVHNHKFHDVHDDSIVVPYRLEGGSQQAWSEQTARNIHRSVVTSLRGAPEGVSLTNAIGQLLYLRTFLRMNDMSTCKGLREGTRDLEDILRLRLDRAKFENELRSSGRASSVTIVLSVIALTLTLVQLLQIPCIKNLSYSSGECGVAFNLPATAFHVVAGTLSHLDWLAGFFLVLLLTLVFFVTGPSVRELYSLRSGHEGFWWHAVRFLYGIGIAVDAYLALLIVTILTLVPVGLFFWVLTAYLSSPE